ncbi:glycoside hydrolase family 3 C-terminal domain-containing protein [Microbacterium sp. KSW2-21]|uniref:Probable beta-glucosidase G n=1 Tax=Microbacterium algihabitans TaxID=3075992 RepID=A0ABU3RTX8_9MICO|nr:glycoside hydrolase family 3 C-terminal domain-containing protein [Microbacterium sp. KSW2-21]MDU0326371.1 glycoside hydrolase family 3 C-terminal domain-containing protein [Microbacterium sp. KSW2-21]
MVALATAVTIGASALLAAPAHAAQSTTPWTDTSLSAQERAQALVAVLTLDEKIELLVQTGGNGIPKYGIPAIKGKDASNGLSNPGGSTALPVGLALASTFDTPLAQQYGAVTGRETREAGFNSAATPTVDLARTPWGGRNWEGFGEDPLLTGTIGAAATAGIQSQGIPAEVKHYNVYNEESRRAHVNAVIDERTLQEIHTRPWESVIRDSNAASVMCSFNKINGEYACGNNTLLNTVLKNQLGFQGFVQTDFNAAHSVLDYNAGMDTSGETLDFSRGNLKQAVIDGRVPEARVTDAARRVLWTMFQYGIYDNPPPAAGPISSATLSQGDKVATVAGQEGTVLLKNDSALPLNSSKLSSIAVIGAGADEYIDGGGSASVTTPTGLTTMLEGITARAGSKVAVRYAAGTDEVGLADTLPGPAPVPSSVLSAVTATYRSGIDAPAGGVLLSRTEKQINLRTGLSADTGNNTSQVPGVGFPTALMPITADWTTTLTPPATGTYKLALTNLGTAKLFIDGQLVLTNPGAEVSTQTVDVPLVLGKPVDVRVTYTTDAVNQFDGSLNDQPGAMLRLGWVPPQGAVAPAMREAADLAKSSDVAIVVVRDYTGEAGDRGNLTLPQNQDELIRQVAAANKRTIVVLATSGAVTMPWIDSVPGVVEAWYGGQTQGDSIASILFGDVNPSGKLPVTFPTTDEQALASGISNPFDIVDQLNPSVEYSNGIDVGYRGFFAKGLDPQFGFGHGLSYTSFEYSKLKLKDVKPAGVAAVATTATVRVKNTGSVAGTEVVQLYVGSLPTQVHTAKRTLAGFARVTLAPGESKNVDVPVSLRSLQYWDVDGDRWVLPSGNISTYVGSSSDDIRAEGTLTVREDKKAPSVSVTVDPKQAGGKNSWGTTPTTLTFAASDDVDTAPVVEASVDGGPFQKVTAPLLIDTDGAHRIEARARDAAGNLSKTITQTVNLDRAAPTVSARLNGRQVTVAAEDAASGVARVEYRIVSAGAPASTSGWKNANASIQLNPKEQDGIRSGALKLEYRATDKAGNVSAVGTLTT